MALASIFVAATAILNLFVLPTVTEAAEPALAYKLVNDYELIWDDSGSGARDDVSIWRPVETQAGYRLLGDVAVKSHSKPSDSTITVIAVVDDALKEPESFTKVWWDKGSGARHDVTIWRMNPPSGYTCLGDIAVRSYSTDDPPVDRYRCVKTEYVTDGTYVSIWKDSGSGARDDVRLWSDTEEGNADAFFANTFTAKASHSSIDGNPSLLNHNYLELYTYTESSYNTSLVALKIYEVSKYDTIWQDKGSGAKQDVSIFRGKGETGYYSLGDQVKNGYASPSLLYIAKTVESDALDAPTGWREVWDDSGSGARKDVKIHYPICRGGYRALGMVAKQSHKGKPDTNSIRCVKNEHTVEGSWKKIWDDKGSGASDDVTLYTAEANDKDGQSVHAMSAVKKHGSMDKTAYVLISTHVQYVVGKPATKYYLTNVVYDFDDSQILSSTPETLARTIIENQGETEQSATRSLEYSYEEEHDWSKEYGLEVGVESSVTAGIPDIAESSITVSVTETTTTSWGESYTESKSDSIEVQITVQPKSKKSATVQSTRYVMDLPYTATLKTEYIDGSTVTDEDYSGVYEGAHIDEIYVIIGPDEDISS